MALNTRSLYDPRRTKHLARTEEASMTSSVLIVRMKPQSEQQEFDWNASGGSQSPYRPIWTGKAGFNEGTDESAKAAFASRETTVYQAGTFRIPLLGGTWESGLPLSDKKLMVEDRVFIIANGLVGLDFLTEYIFILRNPLDSSNAVVKNFVVDADLKGGFNRGN